MQELWLGAPRNDGRRQACTCDFARSCGPTGCTSWPVARGCYTWGVTNDLVRRVDEHKRGLTPGFTSKYHVTRLIHSERFADVRDAIAREKAIKGWGRARKVRLIEERNPTWEDLSHPWVHDPPRRF